MRGGFWSAGPLVCLAITLAGCSQTALETPQVERLPFYIDSDLTPVWLDREAEASVRPIEPFSFVDQSGEQLSRDNLEGKIYVASFIFTTCGGICPRVVSNLLRIQAEYIDDPALVLLSYSVQPNVDSVEVLDGYAREKGIEHDKWRLLTGDKDDIYALARSSYFADVGPDFGRNDADFLHTEKVMLVDGHGRIRGVYNGLVASDMTRLIEDIETLKAVG